MSIGAIVNGRRCAGGAGPQDNFTATSPPTVLDDASAGYAVGSRWIDTLTGQVYTLVDATDGAAQWVESNTSRVVADVDFGAWPETDFAAGGDGTYVLDGLPWQLANTGSASVFRRDDADVGDDEEPGVLIQHAASTSTNFTPSTQTAPRMMIPWISLVPAWVETASYVVELALTRAVATGSVTGGIATRALVCAWKPSGTPPSSPSWASFVIGSAARYSTGGTQPYRPVAEGSGNNNAPRTDLDYDAANGGQVIAFPLRPGPTYASQGPDWPEESARRVTGNIPPLSDGNANTSIAALRDGLLVIALCSAGSYTGQLQVMARGVRVLRVD